LATARSKKIIDKPIKMQFVHYKALMTALWALLDEAARNGSFGRKIGLVNHFFAPREKPAGRGWNVPVNNC
jgi:hypothetical protein